MVRPSVTNGILFVEVVHMRKHICIVFFMMLVTTGVWADDTIEVAQRPNILESMPNVEVLQDSAVALLLEGVKGTLDYEKVPRHC